MSANHDPKNALAAVKALGEACGVDISNVHRIESTPEAVRFWSYKRDDGGKLVFHVTEQGTKDISSTVREYRLQ